MTTSNPSPASRTRRARVRGAALGTAGLLALTLAACAQTTETAEEADGLAEPSVEAEAAQDSIVVMGGRAERTRDMAMAPAAPMPSPAMSSRAMMPAPPPPPQPRPGDIDRDEYSDEEINPVKLVSEEPVSTFSVDVDTASYANVRRFLNDGVMPPSDAVRIEELINYFDYAYPVPDTSEAPFSVSTSIIASPWNPDTQILHVGLKGYDVVPDQRPAANLVFLLDVSGSMNSPDKLPLLKSALRLAVDNLTAQDSVAIVVYAGAAGTVLEPTRADKDGKKRILAALDDLSAGGSTAGGEGLRRAYALAEGNFQEDAVNRVILATDGDFNVGVTSDERLEDFVARKRETGIYLSVFGFGRGNYNDALMQTIAQAGNGTAGYIDTLREAQKALADELSSNLFTIADDVKIQVEFNPERVAEYRLIGYETRMLRREDFNNDQVDAGDIGAGHEVTALYEIAAPGSAGRLIDESRYAQSAAPTGSLSDEFANVRLRYKLPGEDTSSLIERPVTTAEVTARVEDAPQETRFALAVAGYGQLLKDPSYVRDFDFDDVAALAQGAKGEDTFGYRAEFIQLARLAKSAADLEALEQGGQGER